jgi:hypothetical protein
VLDCVLQIATDDARLILESLALSYLATVTVDLTVSLARISSFTTLFYCAFAVTDSGNCSSGGHGFEETFPPPSPTRFAVS